MTKQEALRKASDHAMEDQNYPDKDNIDSELYDTYVKAYMRCWEDSVRGTPDGWVEKQVFAHAQSLGQFCKIWNGPVSENLVPVKLLVVTDN